VIQITAVETRALRSARVLFRVREQHSNGDAEFSWTHVCTQQ